MMEEKTVPYIVFESTMTRLERTIKRLWILCMILLAVIVGSNIAWIYYENQFEDVVITQETEAGGDNNYVGEDGNITVNK